MRPSKMRQLRALLWALSLAILPLPEAVAQSAQASKPPPWLLSQLPGAVPVGQGILRFLGLAVYDAVLFVPLEESPTAGILKRPFALSLHYKMRFSGANIAQTSIDEIKRLGRGSVEQHAKWLTQMTSVFPDVVREDQITGVHRPGQGASFFFNGRFLGRIDDPEFSEAFFSIWLDPETREPRLREALLAGLAAAAGPESPSASQRTSR
nr:hypothetical protein NCPCFENI_01039 [Cupriavidus sp.]